MPVAPESPAAPQVSGRLSAGFPWWVAPVVIWVWVGVLVSCRPPVRNEIVADVLDGDSLVVWIDGRRQEVRLYGVDCPERGQPHADRAKAFSRDTVLNEPVRLEVRDQDAYGRWVAEAFLADGRSLNTMLVREGWAWWYRDYAGHRRDLARLEREARRAGRGLWAEKDPTPPWDYRASRRAARSDQSR